MKAKQEGIRLYRDRNDGRHYASSASTPGLLHYVTLASCDCIGFVHHGRCKHHSALVMAHLLQQAGTPDPTTPAAGPCSCCHGVGTVESKRSRWVGGSQLGYRHSWTVEVECEACQGTGDAAPIAA